MSKLYAVYAFENMFCGMHGINDFEVVEAQNEKEVEEYAHDVSCQVIEDYMYDYIDLENEEEFNLDIAYDFWEITKETNKSLDILNDLFYNNPEDFIQEYCGIKVHL